MKTMLEWVSVDIVLPRQSDIYALVIKDIKRGYKFTNFGIYYPYPKGSERFESRGKTFLKKDGFIACHDEEILAYAYVNLPEDEEERKEVYKISCWCDKCNKGEGETKKFDDYMKNILSKKEVKEVEESAKEAFRSHEFRSNPVDVKKIDIKDIRPTHFEFVCEKCSEHQKKKLTCDNCQNDGWIWPLKRLPEKANKVEVKIMNDKVNQKGFFDGTWFKSSYCCEVMEHECDKFIFDDVIAWRPLMEEMKTYQCQDCHKSFKNKEIMMFCDECKGIKNKAEDRKSDFSKLKEGDAVIIEKYDGSFFLGFFKEEIGDVGEKFKTRKFFSFSSKKGNYYHASSFFTYGDEIKKIIRINIDEAIPFVRWDSEIYAYPFEEI